MAHGDPQTHSQSPGRHGGADGGRLPGGSRLLGLPALALVLIALTWVQCLVPITQQNMWDVDPRSEAGRAPITEIQPGQFAWLNVATVLTAAAALWAHGRAGGRIDRWAMALAGAGIVACLAHLRGDVADLTRCGCWIAAASAGVAMMHLAQHELVRRWLAAAFLALAIPLAVMAVWYVAAEHPFTVRTYEGSRDAFLRARGWAPDSPMATLYERRLRNPQFTGPLAMSNVTGSVAAALFVAGAVVTVTCWRTGRRWPLGISAAATTAAAIVVGLAQSKGAAAAVALVLGSLAVCIRSRGWSLRWRGLARAAIAALWLVPIAAVTVRGLTWRPGSTGELSLLVRFQYWRAVPRILGEFRGLDWLVGLGPEGFRLANLRLKDPFNPEDVVSLHQVFLDWIVTLGAGGAAWTALALLALWRATAALDRRDEAADRSEVADDARPKVYVAGALAMAIFLVQRWVRAETMVAETALLWLFNLLAFAVVLSALVCDRGAWSRVTGLALLAAAAVLLTHAQIEMTWHHAGSAALAWTMLGAAAGAGTAATRAGELPPAAAASFAAGVVARSDAWRWPCVGATLALGLVMIVGYAAPLQRHDAALADVAAAMRHSRDFRQVDAAFDRALTILPRDPTTTRAAAWLWLEIANLAARERQQDLAVEALTRADQHLDRARTAAHGHEDLRLLRTRLAVIEVRARIMGDPASRAERVPVLERVLAASPYNLADQVMLADALWELERSEEAKRAYRRALDLHAWSYLDPARQLRDADLARVRERAGAP